MPYKGSYIARGKQKYHIANTPIINIDNGSGTTADYVPVYFVDDTFLVDAYIVYTEATDTTGAAGANVKLGTTAGGNDVVAATNLGTSKAVGAATALTLAKTFIPAGSSIFVRHTGIATTEAGQYFVQLRYFPK